MRLLISMAFVVSIFCASGCELNQVKGEVAGVEVEAKTKDSNADFCPPGQAKKGNC
jgi:hypothetical protein